MLPPFCCCLLPYGTEQAHPNLLAIAPYHAHVAECSTDSGRHGGKVPAEVDDTLAWLLGIERPVGKGIVSQDIQCCGWAIQKLLRAAVVCWHVKLSWYPHMYAMLELLVSGQVCACF